MHFLIPFAAFPLASAMRAVDEKTLLAARGMGAGRMRVFAKVFIPMTALGILGAGKKHFFLYSYTYLDKKIVDMFWHLINRLTKWSRA